MTTVPWFTRATVSSRRTANGNVVNSAGQNLQVYAALQNGGFNTGNLTNLNITTNVSAPQATTTASITASLPADATAPTNPTFNPSDPTSYTDTTSMTVYDSLGAAHTASLYFIKGATANDWTTQLYVDGTAVGTPQALDYTTSGALTDSCQWQGHVPGLHADDGCAAA